MIARIVILIFIPFASWGQHLEFKGWVETTREISTRLAQPGEDLPMETFLPADGLEVLVGTWENAGAIHRFRNGTPNPMNMMIWYYTFSGFSRSIANSCQTPSPDLNTSFKKILSRICTWPSADAQSDAVMLDFWFAVMGYNAPEDEFVAWRDFFRSSSFKSKTGATVVEAMTLSMGMNPYFLLKQ